MHAALFLSDTQGSRQRGGLTRVLEGLEEGGVAQQPLEAAGEHGRVLQRAVAHEVLHKLGRRVVAEEGQVELLDIVEELLQLSVIARSHTRRHCTYQQSGSASESASQPVYQAPVGQLRASIAGCDAAGSSPGIMSITASIPDCGDSLVAGRA